MFRPPCRGDVGRGRVLLGARRRMQDDAGVVRVVVEGCERGERLWVAPVQPHDLGGREHPPVVGLRVVAEPGQLPPGAGVRRRATSRRRPSPSRGRPQRRRSRSARRQALRRRAAAPGRDCRSPCGRRPPPGRPARIAPGRTRGSAPCRRSRGPDRTARRPCVAWPGGVPPVSDRRRDVGGHEPRGEPSAPREVDAHPEEVAPGLRQDLRQPGRSGDVGAGDRRPGARRSRAARSPRPGRGRSRCRPSRARSAAGARRPPRRGDDPAGALGIEDLAQPEGRGLLERLRASVGVLERISWRSRYGARAG